MAAGYGPPTGPPFALAVAELVPPPKLAPARVVSAAPPAGAVPEACSVGEGRGCCWLTARPCLGVAWVGAAVLTLSAPAAAAAAFHGQGVPGPTSAAVGCAAAGLDAWARPRSAE
eukprot:scaffold193879_cov16-Tisochrysis_lutea.AAC.1